MINQEILKRNILFKKTKKFYGMKISNLQMNEYINNKSFYILEKKTDKLIEKKEKKTLILNKLINLCMRKGNKKLALKNIKKSFQLIRTFYWINPILLLKIVLLKTEPFIKLDRYMFGNKEKIIPRFINLEKRMNYSLKSVVDVALKNKKNYKYFYISLVHALIEYTMPNNIIIEKNKENNELAELNKFHLYKNKKKKRKMRIIKKIKDWKK